VPKEFLLFLAFSWPALGADDGAVIMAKVVANVEKAADSRRQFLYHQAVTTNLVRPNGQISRKENRQYEVFPSENATEKKLISLRGEARQGKTVTTYGEAGYKKKNLDIDGDLMRDLTSDLVDEKKSRDGIPASLFPLRAKDLDGYRFTLKEEFEYQGRRTYKILFEPNGKHSCVNIGGDDDDCEGASWKGELWIDVEELQPARIFTEQAFRVPWGVKVFLGTNIQRSGFSVSYQRVAENVWFPASYGTEFRFNALWGYRRTVTLSLESSGFQKTDIASKIRYEGPPVVSKKEP